MNKTIEQMVEDDTYCIVCKGMGCVACAAKHALAKEIKDTLDGMTCASSPEFEAGYKMAVKDAKERLNKILYEWRIEI